MNDAPSLLPAPYRKKISLQLFIDFQDHKLIQKVVIRDHDGPDMQAELFETLKSALRARGWTYADLATKLGISEPTIKRIFARRDSKLSRLVDICDALDLTLDDLIAQSNRTETTPLDLSDLVERQLSENLPAFHLFILLREGLTALQVTQQFNLDQDAVFRLGLQLERMGLVEVRPNNRLKLCIEGPIRFRRSGPLHRALAELNLSFIRKVFMAEDSDTAGFQTQSRHMSAATARHVMRRIDELFRELRDLARQDQLTISEKDLQSRKLSIAFSTADYAQLFDLRPDR